MDNNQLNKLRIWQENKMKKIMIFEYELSKINVFMKSFVNKS